MKSAKKHFSSTAISICLLILSPAWSAIIKDGDVFPNTNPATWTSSTVCRIAYFSGDGSLTVNGGSSLTVSSFHLCNDDTTTATVNIDGAGSTVTLNNFSLYGNSFLNVTNAATLSGTSSSHIGYDATSSGKVSVDGAGSSLTNSGSYLFVGFNAGSLPQAILLVAMA